MKTLTISAIFIALNVAAPAAWAVSIYECEDESGNRSFHDRCPPGTTQVTKKQYSTQAGQPGKKSLAALTLYVVPNCDTCNQVKEFLAVRNIAVSERDVNENIDLQNELQEKTGNLKVPTLIIGEQTLTGYERNTLLQALTEAGYIEEE